MTPEDAVVFINEHVSYKPGWQFNAWQSGPFGPIYLKYNYRTEDTSLCCQPDQRVGGKFPGVSVDGDARIHVTPDDNEITLTAKLLGVFISAETHEAREFLQVDGKAPFHPHRIDGAATWKSHRAHTVPRQGPDSVGGTGLLMYGEP